MNLVKLILSVDTPVQTGMTTDTELNKLITKYQDIFHGIGVPVALRDKVKQELDLMVSNDIITKVTEPTDWVNSMVVVQKPNGDLHACLDPGDLNKAIKRPYYPVPTLNDVTSELAGAKHFSVLDARSGYWQIKLSDTSSRLTTFNTPFGRFRYLRMPFGVNSAQDIFQRRVDATYENLPGVTGIKDDVLVAGSMKKGHLETLHATFQRTLESGQRYNLSICRFNVPEVAYYGHVISADGIKADPRKVEAIVNCPDKTELQMILGITNYLAKFAPNLRNITAPMRDLLKKESEYLWDAQQEAALASVKDIVTKNPVLAFYDRLQALPSCRKVDQSYMHREHWTP